MPSRRGTFPNADSAGKLSSTGDTTTDSPRTLPARRGTLTTNDQPRPLPPKLKKKEFLKNINFADIDYIVSEAPLDLLTKSMWDVVEYLVITPDGKQIGDLLKIRAIFRWMTSYDVYSIDSEMIPPTDSPLEHMLKIQCDLISHAQMFYMLCLLADIPCVIINGITKGELYKVGCDIKCDELYSQWNAVYVKGQWQFVDVFWASTCVLGRNIDNTINISSDGKISREGDIDEIVKYHEFYFFSDPNELIYTHFPDEEFWQLLPVPVNFSKFEKSPYLREYFHMYEMSIVERSCISNKLTAEKETINISFALPPKRSSNYIFKVMLTQQRTQIQTNKPVDILLERFVSVIHTQDKVIFKVRLPFYGKYQFDVYGCDFTKSNNFSLVCSYMIDCIDPKEPCLPFPDFPEIGFGNNPHAEKLDIYAISPKSPFVRTGNGVVEFIIHIDAKLEISHMLKSLLIGSGTLSRHVVARREKDKYIANIKLPREGEYAVKFYIGQTEDNITQNVPADLLNFVIKFKGEERPCNLPYPNITEGQLGAKLDAMSLGVRCLSKTGDSLKAPDGRASFRFLADESVELLCELSCCKRDGNSRVSVETEVNNGVWKFDVDMPIPAEYSMNVFAFKKNDHSRLHQIHSFFIHSEGNIVRRVRFSDDSIVENIISDTIITAKPDVVIPIPSPTQYEALFTTVRKTDEKIYENENEIKVKTSKDSIEIHLNDYGEYVLEVFTHDKYENAICTSGRFYIHFKKDEDIFEGDFQELVNTLKPVDEIEPVEEPIPDRKDSVFEQSQFEEVCSEDSDSDNAEVNEEQEMDGNESDTAISFDEDITSVVFTEDGTKSVAMTEDTDFQEEMDEMEEIAKEQFKQVKEKSIKKTMTKALKSKDLKQMKTQLKRFKQFDLDPEDKMVAYVQKVVKELTVKEKMSEACRRRNPKTIKKYINEAKEANFDHRLDMQIQLSTKILDRVTKVEKLMKPLLKMNQNMLTEMKKYMTPPESVHQILKATCILLGDDPKKLQTWKDCQGLLFKTGKENIMRRVSQFDFNSTSPAMINKINSILKPYNLVQIRDASIGAAAFYLWITGILDEIKKPRRNKSKDMLPRSSRPRPATLSVHHHGGSFQVRI
ncbi:uncharacterized protein [Mytilus edulis]|uniref:uncharacterized protein n=1 Tax=Mytilus edulis TaxID=6550 RepID=UPI0039F02A72